ncbi:hypothetical protein MHBO_001672 [Bonamia ostreae]|uniref:Uncharacterized protein n=1 Tax=Bonamia ostreae TaxID=126728 RepID=A0ABV2AKK8_9EUKA
MEFAKKLKLPVECPLLNAFFINCLKFNKHNLLLEHWDKFKTPGNFFNNKV